MLWENRMLKNRLKRLKKPRKIYRSCKNSQWKRKKGSSSSSEKLNRCQRSSNSNMKRSLNLWRRKLSLKSLRSREKRKKKRSRWFISKNCTKERCKGSSYRCKFTRGSRTTKMGEMMKFTDSSSKLRISNQTKTTPILLMMTLKISMWLKFTKLEFQKKSLKLIATCFSGSKLLSLMGGERTNLTRTSPLLFTPLDQLFLFCTLRINFTWLGQRDWLLRWLPILFM